MATYYVATTGNDNNAGSSVAPWLTIQHALNTMVAGDTTNILSGTYTSTMLTFENSGNASNYITLQNYNNQTVNIVITGTSWAGLSTGAQSYLNIIGLNISGVSVNNDIDIYASNYVNVTNCNCGVCTYSGIAAEQYSTYITLSDCTCTGTNTAGMEEMISFYGINHFEIKNCICHDPGSNGRIGICLKDSTQNSGIPSQNGSVHNCTVYNLPGFTISNGIYPGNGATNINVYDNLIYNTGGEGLAMENEDTAGTLTNVWFYNNIVYNCYRAASMWENGGLSKFSNCGYINNTFYNNDIVGGSANPTQQIVTDCDSSHCTGCVIRNNIVVGQYVGDTTLADANGVLTVDHNDWYNSAGSWAGGSLYGSSYITTNPLLINPTSNFALQTGSPCIDTGSSTLAPSTDYNGTSRPQGAGYDIGAYEYAVTTNVTPGTVNHNSGQGTTAAQYISTSHHTLTMPAAIDARINNALTSSDAAVIDAIRTALINMGMIRAS